MSGKTYRGRITPMLFVEDLSEINMDLGYEDYRDSLEPYKLSQYR